MTTNDLLLSVCVMTYNRIVTLKQAVHSILQDIGGDGRAELVICDNASDDGTMEYCTDLVADYQCVRYVRNRDNLGFDGNVVTCLKQAHGRFVSLFSDDDIALPGTFMRILTELEQVNPTVLYLNHYTFQSDDLRRRDRSKLPSHDKLYDDGREFFLFVGLGFLSALTVKTSVARRYLVAARMGHHEAHLDVVSRMCLLENGPFLYVGSVAVAARAPMTWRPEWLRGCAIEVAKFYHGLADEALLDVPMVTKRVRSSISNDLLRLVLADKCLGDDRERRAVRRELISVYGRYWEFWALVAPVLVIPRMLLRPPYLLTRFVLRRFRQLRVR